MGLLVGPGEREGVEVTVMRESDNLHFLWRHHILASTYAKLALSLGEVIHVIS